MMKKSSLVAASLAATLCANSFGASLDVDLNNDSLHAQYNLSDTNAQLGLSVGALLTDDQGEVIHFTARTQGALAQQQFVRGGFGGRAYFANPDGGDSFQSLGLGGFVDVTVPQMTDLVVGLELYYAPSITTSDDIDNLREITFKVSYQLFENAKAYAGMRHLEVEQGNFDYEFDDGFHIGFTLDF